MANLTEAEAAERLGYEPQTLRKWRYRDIGPAYIQPEGGRGIRYREVDLDAWERAQLHVPVGT